MEKQIIYADTAKRAGGIIAIIRDQDRRIVWEGDYLHSYDAEALAEAEKELRLRDADPAKWDELMDRARLIRTGRL